MKKKLSKYTSKRQKESSSRRKQVYEFANYNQKSKEVKP